MGLFVKSVSASRAPGWKRCRKNTLDGVRGPTTRKWRARRACQPLRLDCGAKFPVPNPESVFVAERRQPQSLIVVMLPNDLSLKGESRSVPGWRRKILRTRRGKPIEHVDKIFV
jgi:hypothetical protein